MNFNVIVIFYYLWTRTETAPVLVPFLPVKDIADEGKNKLSSDMENLTPSELKVATKGILILLNEVYSKNGKSFIN